jgi:hypothetical protein
MTVAALSSDLVKTIQEQKLKVESQLQERTEECNQLKDRLLESQDTIHDLKMKSVTTTTAATNKPNNVPVKSSTKDQADEIEEDLRHGLVNDGSNETISIVLMAVGSFILVSAIVVMLVLHLQLGLPIHPAFWGTLSGAVVGSLMLGWGLPALRHN